MCSLKYKYVNIYISKITTAKINIFSTYPDQTLYFFVNNCIICFFSLVSCIFAVLFLVS